MFSPIPGDKRNEKETKNASYRADVTQSVESCVNGNLLQSKQVRSGNASAKALHPGSDQVFSGKEDQG
jgi:hypothetical protein